MTIFAGIVSLGPRRRALPAAAVTALTESLSRHASTRRQVLAGPHHAVALIDFGVFNGGAARSEPSGAISLLAGDPLIAQDDSTTPRGPAFDQLHQDWVGGSVETLQKARGSFCGIHLDPVGGRLWLIADKLGLRPIYYALLEDFVIFATSMRMLRECPLISRDGDFQGLAETACYGYPLGSRTDLAAMHVLEAAQIVEVTATASRRFTYWRWDAVPALDLPDDQICTDIDRAFSSAVKSRLDPNRRAVSLLSAGLDSRCVVARLCDLHAEVDTIGFGPEGSADQLIARQVASAFGARHFELARGFIEFWPRLASAHDAWIQGPGRDWPDPQARALWSGEGGDRILAPVNLYEDVIEAMRAGDAELAISRYMRAERTGLPRRLFTRPVRESVRGLPRAGLRYELERHEHEDAARRFHLYVLVNEARRNIKQHFEDLDQSRVELIMPFYDSELVRIVLRHPIDRLVRHRLYHRWLRIQSPLVREIPWQAYPGAEPCPLPLPPGARYQWVRWHSEEEEGEIRKSELAQADEILGQAGFPHWLLRRPVLRAARLLLKFGIRRFSYLFDVARPFVMHPPPMAAWTESVDTGRSSGN